MSMISPNTEQQDIITAPVNVPLKVIAGAGTGKTQTLTNRFLHLVEKEGFSAQSILAITFTDKAAAEMAARIRGALAKNGQPVERELAIFTFHAFARRLLRDYPDEAGVSPDFTVLSEIPQKLALRRVFQEAAAGNLDIPGLRLDDLAALDVKKLDDVRRLALTVISRAKGNRWTPDQWLKRASDADERFYGALPDADKAQTVGSGKDKLTEIIHHHMRNAGFPCRDLDLCLNGNKNEPEVRKVYFPNLRQSRLRDDLNTAFEDQRSRTQKTLETITELFRAYNERLQEQNALDFDDLILRAVDMLEQNEHVRKSVRERFQYILVDEFQDTSPAQMDLIRSISHSQPCPGDCSHRTSECNTHRPQNVTIVGDKKQAIYAWRNARKENLDQLIPCTGPDVCKPLSRNYRSERAVIGLANTIGARVEPGDPELQGEREGEGSLHLPASFDHGKAQESRKHEAIYIAERIQMLASRDRVPYSDIAILLRKGSQFVALREAFRNRNIPYVYQDAAGLLNEPTARDVLAALRAISRPEDDLALYRLLSRPPVALSDAELVSLRRRTESPRTRPFQEALAEAPAESPAGQLHARLEAARRLAAGLTVADLLEYLPSEMGFAAGWKDDERAVWPQALAVLRSMAEEAEQVSPVASVEDVLDLLDTYEEEESATISAPPMDAEGVRVMTIHKAKGLEFPIVFVPSIQSARKDDSGWIWDDDWGLLPDFAESTSAKRTIARWLRTRKDESEDEEDRCWYVAATRAEKHICVTGIVLQKNPQIPVDLREREPDEWDPADWQTVVTERQRADGTPTEAANQPLEAPGLQIARNVSFSALAEFQSCPVSVWIRRVWKLPEEALDSLGGGGHGRRIGDLFHLAAARWYAGNREGLPDYLMQPQESDAVRDGLRSRWAWFVTSEVAKVSPVAVERRVCYPHETSSGTLMVNGFVDLLLPDEGNRCIVADFKTNHELGEETIQDYAVQLALYRMALQRERVSTSPTGLLIHISESGIREIPVILDDHIGRVQNLLDEYAKMIQLGALPDRREHSRCEFCGYGTVCPGQVV